jgi:hypothetical protein
MTPAPHDPGFLPVFFLVVFDDDQVHAEEYARPVLKIRSVNALEARLPNRLSEALLLKEMR